jgi:hypothetical protein
LIFLLFVEFDFYLFDLGHFVLQKTKRFADILYQVAMDKDVIAFDMPEVD